MKLSITAGELLQIVSILIGCLAVYVRLSEKITAIETKLDMVLKWYQNCVNGDCPVQKEIREKNIFQQLKQSVSEGD